MKTKHEHVRSNVRETIPSRALTRDAPEPAARPAPHAPIAYGAWTRGATAAFLMVVPFLVLYEGGIAAMGGNPALRTGADVWIRDSLLVAARVPHGSSSLILSAMLVGWAMIDRRRRAFRARWLPYLIIESALFAVGLVGLSILLDLGFSRYAGRIVLERVAEGRIDRLAPFLGYIGAGLFEEAMFRLALLPVMFAVLRACRAPTVAATTLAVTGSALVFSMAHHIGAPPGEFSWYVFVFRWFAGVYFAWVFILRGFGVAVGTHVAYDVLVGSLPWSRWGL